MSTSFGRAGVPQPDSPPAPPPVVVGDSLDSLNRLSSQHDLAALGGKSLDAGVLGSLSFKDVKHPVSTEEAGDLLAWLDVVASELDNTEARASAALRRVCGRLLNADVARGSLDDAEIAGAVGVLLQRFRAARTPRETPLSPLAQALAASAATAAAAASCPPSPTSKLAGLSLAGADAPSSSRPGSLDSARGLIISDGPSSTGSAGGTLREEDVDGSRAAKALSPLTSPGRPTSASFRAMSTTLSASIGRAGSFLVEKMGTAGEKVATGVVQFADRAMGPPLGGSSAHHVNQHGVVGEAVSASG